MVPTQIKGRSALSSPLTQILISFGNTLTDTSNINTLHLLIRSSSHSLLTITMSITKVTSDLLFLKWSGYPRSLISLDTFPE
uniref:Macaca fascicularis brain cDNA clone: QflA-18080, similar to human hypothetical protein LOC284551 (LOC284551), mRNA, RefSeq: XM_375713.1 n=1 Tax=Macaca fascicularis TaxID=9541 RepID=I7GLF6_MACFA|nr:unnamed protein product [Macaca fascicularis]